MSQALIVGATGLVGAFCVDALCQFSSYDKIVILSRKPLNNLNELKSTFSGELENLIVDFDKLDNRAACFQVDDVYCCLGTTLKKAGSIKAFRKVDYDYCYESAVLAKEGGAKHFLIVTAVNANENSMAYYSKIKGQLEHALKDLDFEHLSIFQPSFLIGPREEHRLLEGAFGKVSMAMSSLMPKAVSALKPIEGKVVAQSMVKQAELATKNASEMSAVNYLTFNKMQELSKSLQS